MCSKSNPLVVFALDLMSAYEGEHMILVYFLTHSTTHFLIDKFILFAFRVIIDM
jgi:hypothetical protein